MLPEESVQAQVVLPVHWGTFAEANHSWNEPVERAVAEASRRHLPLIMPEIGQLVVLGQPLPQQPRPQDTWLLGHLNHLNKAVKEVTVKPTRLMPGCNIIHRVQRILSSVWTFATYFNNFLK